MSDARSMPEDNTALPTVGCEHALAIEMAIETLPYNAEALPQAETKVSEDHLLTAEAEDTQDLLVLPTEVTLDLQGLLPTEAFHVRLAQEAQECLDHQGALEAEVLVEEEVEETKILFPSIINQKTSSKKAYFPLVTLY